MITKAQKSRFTETARYYRRMNLHSYWSLTAVHTFLSNFIIIVNSAAPLFYDVYLWVWKERVVVWGQCCVSSPSLRHSFCLGNTTLPPQSPPRSCNKRTFGTVQTSSLLQIHFLFVNLSQRAIHIFFGLHHRQIRSLRRRDPWIRVTTASQSVCNNGNFMEWITIIVSPRLPVICDESEQVPQRPARVWLQRARVREANHRLEIRNTSWLFPDIHES
jgi:hypothetical protein